MSIRVGVSQRSLPPVVRQANNTNEVAQRPDPNGGMETYQRNNPQPIAGSHGPMQHPTAGADMRAPVSMAGLEAAANATDTGDSAQYNAQNQAQVATGKLSSADAMQRARNDRMNKTAVKVMNPNARLFTQALYNSGANVKMPGMAGAFESSDALRGLLAASDQQLFGRRY